MSESLNMTTPNPSKTLHQRIARTGWIGWAFAGLFAVAFVIQSIAYTLRPEVPIAIDDTGRLKGYIVWNDTVIRDDAQVMADLKRWVGYRTSLNSETIWEDAEISLNHMSDELFEQNYNDWLDTGYLRTIEEVGGVSKVEFAEDSIELNRDLDRFDAVINGRLKVGIVNPQYSEFRVRVRGRLVPYSEEKSLGVEVQHYEDI